MATATIPIPNEIYFDLVWENLNVDISQPSQALPSFASQTVDTEDLSDAKGLLLFYFANNTDADRLMSVMRMMPHTVSGVTTYGALTAAAVGGSVIRTRRWYANYSESKVTFNNGYSGTTQSNDNCIPYRIYKIRY